MDNRSKKRSRKGLDPEKVKAKQHRYYERNKAAILYRRAIKASTTTGEPLIDYEEFKEHAAQMKRKRRSSEFKERLEALKEIADSVAYTFIERCLRTVKLSKYVVDFLEEMVFTTSRKQSETPNKNTPIQTLPGDTTYLQREKRTKLPEDTRCLQVQIEAGIAILSQPTIYAEPQFR